MMKLINKILSKLGLRLYQLKGIMTNPLDEKNIEILDNLDFLKSCKEVKPFSLLDTNRLINLWEYCQRSNEKGVIIEVGSYKGGGALHLSNSQPKRKIFIFDSFEGFQTIDTKLDANFNMQQFKDTEQSKVENLFINNNRDVLVTAGFFPESAKNLTLPPISFVHLDVDIYKATIESLIYLDNLMMDKSFILLDDCRRNCEGVDKAIDEFLSVSKNWIYLPLFPSQGLLVHHTWFNK
jgi:Macrocin-O-methyltransferase (TylF)